MHVVIYVDDVGVEVNCYFIDEPAQEIVTDKSIENNVVMVEEKNYNDLPYI